MSFENVQNSLKLLLIGGVLIVVTIYGWVAITQEFTPAMALTVPIIGFLQWFVPTFSHLTQTAWNSLIAVLGPTSAVILLVTVLMVIRQK